MNDSSLFFFVVLLCGFFVYKFFNNSRKADDYSLFSMPKWIVLANSGRAGGVSRMSYSLLIQAGNILEVGGVYSLSSLRQVMRRFPSLKKHLFIILVVKTSEMIHQENNELDIYLDSFENSEARLHLAKCFATLMANGIAIDDIAEASTYESEFGGKGLEFMADIGRSFDD